MSANPSAPGSPHEWCPPGLQDLCRQKTIYFKKDPHFFGAGGRFKIKDAKDNILYTAESESSFFGNSVSNASVKLPNDGTTVLLINNSHGDLSVEAPPGTVIGYLSAPDLCCGSTVTGYDKQKQALIEIDGGACNTCCGESSFPVTSPRWGSVGFPPLEKDNRTFSSDKLQVGFPDQIDNLTKIILFASAFIIDVFEEQRRRNS